MADNSKDVALNLSVTTTGQQAITDLTQKVNELAKKGGAAAPEFEKLAAELERLGAQSQAVEAVSKLGAEFDQAAASQAKLAAETKKVGDGLDALSATTREAIATQAAESTELRRLQEALAGSKSELKALKNDTDAAGKTTSDYKSQVRALTAEQIELERIIRSQADVLRSAKAATSEAEAAERKAASAYKESATALERSTAAAGKVGAALSSAKQAMGGTELATNDLAAAQLKLQQAIESVSFKTQAAEAKAAAAAEQAESDRLAQIVIANRNKMLAAAQDELAAERRAQAEALRVFEQYEQRKVDAARKAAQQLGDAFSTAGVRSLEAIQTEALGVERAMTLMAERFRLGEISAESLARGIAGAKVRLQELHNEAARTPALKGQFEQLSETIGGIVNRFGALGATLGAIGYAFKPVVDAAVQLDSMRRALTAITGSSAEAEKQIAFLSDTAKRAGVSASDLSESFVRFSASARASGISTKVVQDVFEATTLAAGNLGLSSDKVSHILDALAQMANKGVVSMEELRQQLGDSLPGALSLMAKGLGLTEHELVKLVESGKLLTVDALPALADALKSLGPAGGEVKGLSASFASLKNAATDAMRVFADSGFSDVLVASLKLVGTVLYPLIQGFTLLFDVVITGAKAAGVALGALASGDWKDGLAQIGVLTDGLVNRQVKLSNALQQATFFADDHARAQTGSGQATATAGQQAAGATTQHAGNAAAQGQAAGAADANATAQQAAGNATAAAGAAAAGASVSWAKLTSDYTLVNAEVDRMIALAEKAVQVKRTEGQVAQELAKLSGDERTALSEAALAALNYSAALSNVAEKRQTAVAVLQAEREALLEVIRVQGDANGQREKEIAQLDALIASRTAESDRAREAAELARVEAAARTTARMAYEDNSKALAELKAAYEFAKDAAMVWHDAVATGAATVEQAAQADREAAQAEALYRDALDDTAKAADRKVAAIERNTNLMVRSLQVQLEHARTQEREAELYGMGATAIQKRIEQKEIEIKIVQANIEAAKQEAAAIIATAEAMRAELAALGQLTPEKEAEIDARIANAKAKQIEAQAGKEKIAQIELEIEAIRRGQSTQSAASSSNVASIESETSALERQLDAREKEIALIERAAEAERKRRGVDKNGFVTDANGNTIQMQGVDANYVIELFKGQGLSDSEAKRAASELVDSNGNVHLNGYSSIFEAVVAIAKKYKGGSGLGGTNDTSGIPMLGGSGGGGGLIGSGTPRGGELGSGGSGSGTSGGAGTSGGSDTGSSSGRTGGAGTGGGDRTVTFVIDGKRTNVSVGSDADADSLEAILKQLSDAARRG